MAGIKVAEAISPDGPPNDHFKIIPSPPRFLLLAAGGKLGHFAHVMRFLIQVCLGVLRHQEYRRNFLAGLVIAALVLLFLGSTWLSGWLASRPFTFILFWFACIWFTATSFLLAAYDLIAVRKVARAEEKRLREEILAQHKPH